MTLKTRHYKKMEKIRIVAFSAKAYDQTFMEQAANKHTQFVYYEVALNPTTAVYQKVYQL